MNFLTKPKKIYHDREDQEASLSTEPLFIPEIEAQSDTSIIEELFHDSSSLTVVNGNDHILHINNPFVM